MLLLGRLAHNIVEKYEGKIKKLRGKTSDILYFNARNRNWPFSHHAGLTQDLRVDHGKKSWRRKEDNQERIFRGDGDICENAGKDTSKKTYYELICDRRKSWLRP